MRLINFRIPAAIVGFVLIANTVKNSSRSLRTLTKITCVTPNLELQTTAILHSQFN